MADSKEQWVVVRIARTRIGDRIYDTAEEAMEDRDTLAKTFPGNEYAIAHITFPLEASA